MYIVDIELNTDIHNVISMTVCLIYYAPYINKPTKYKQIYKLIYFILPYMSVSRFLRRNRAHQNRLSIPDIRYIAKTGERIDHSCIKTHHLGMHFELSVIIILCAMYGIGIHNH